jgi:serine/threonine protein kinase
VNGEWLRRAPKSVELAIIALAGVILGAGCSQFRPAAVFGGGAAVALLLAVGAVFLTYFTDFWFPWLIVVGGQIPCAMAIGVASAVSRRSSAEQKTLEPGDDVLLPETPGYELLNPPFAQGSYGKVWLAKNAIGQWQAVKVVYAASFGDETEPYDREFEGIRSYKPVSDKHPGLLRVEFVSNKNADYFYYVMELGDALNPDWEKNPLTYKPRDLANERARAPRRRLPVSECIRIGLALTDTLDFLHRQGLTHRDIKPQNIIFVNGQPKLADIGLVAEIRAIEQEPAFVGTPGYMPPHPESPGSPQADIYALGMVLYVLSTGREAPQFPELATTLVSRSQPVDFLPLNAVILKACEPDRTRRYQSASEMHKALLHVQQLFHKQLGPAEEGASEHLASEA